MTMPPPHEQLPPMPWWMRALLMFAVVYVIWALTVEYTKGADWITAPSYYTHKDGERVSQYQRIEVFHQPNYNQGGWSRSVIRGPDGSIDMYWSGTYRGYVSPYWLFNDRYPYRRFRW